ncbi:MAG: TonB-dependent receptor [Bacteroidales bacterium]|nr:TonB-dependent receptor [Bacteroidales bacterium]
MYVPEKEVKSGAFTFKRWSRKSWAIFHSLGMEIKIAGLSLLVSATLLPKDVDAQNQDTTVLKDTVEMDEVVVTAQRNEVIYSQMARMVEVLDKEEIDRLPAQSIDQLLEYAMNVDIRQRGGMSVQSDISIRSGSFDQTMILLNGINVTDPQTGHHNLNLPIDLSAIKRIEILSGPGSRIFGPNAFSGAINIITGNDKENSVKTGLQYGENAFLKSTASASIKKSSLKHFIATNYSKTNGYIANTDFKTGSVYYQASYKNNNDNKLDVQLGYNQKAFGANSFYTPEYPDQFEKTKTRFGSLSYQFGNRLKTEFNAYWRRHNDRFELFRNDVPAWYSSHNYHRTDVGGISVNSVLPLKSGLLSFGSELRSERILSNVLGESMEEPVNIAGVNDVFYTHSANRENFSVFSEYSRTWRKFYLTLGVMANFNNGIINKWQFFPGIDLGYDLNRKWQAFASASHGMRLPTFTDIYYDGPVNIGNLDLKPEKSTSVEAGFKYLSRKLIARGSVFHRWGNDIIDWVKNDEQDLWRTRNLTNLNTTGFSLQTKYYINSNSELYQMKALELNYSYAIQQKESYDFISRYALDYLKHKLNARFVAGFFNKFTLAMAMTWQDRAGGFLFYENNSYTVEKAYEPFWLVDVELAYHITNFKFTASGINVLNEQYFDIGNVRQPGRWIKLGIQYHFDFSY